MIRFLLTGLGMACMLAASAIPASADDIWSNGFEADTSGWYRPIDDSYGTARDYYVGVGPQRVASGTNGITASSGSWFAKAPYVSTLWQPSWHTVGGWNTGPYTDFGGATTAFPDIGHFITDIDFYLDPSGGWDHDTRFDWTVQVNENDAVGNHQRDYVFNVGFRNDGSDRFEVSVSNCASRWDSNPYDSAHVDITDAGWYTFTHTFTDTTNLNPSHLLTVDMSITKKGDTDPLGTWQLSDPSDIVGNTVGAYMQGWIAANEFEYLAFDNVRVHTPEPSSIVLLLVGGLALLSRALGRRRAGPKAAA